MHTSNCYILPLAILLVAMQTVCCTKDEGAGTLVADEKVTDEKQADGKVPMVITPVCEITKATHGIDGTELPERYVIWTSAYINDMEGIINPGDYFRNQKFVKSAGKPYWAPEIPLYWPLGSSLDILTVAMDTTSMDFRGNVRWNSENCSKGVSLTVDDSLCHDSEILYSSACGLTEKGGSIPLSYKHSQTWLCFEMECNVEGQLVLDSIIIKDVFGGGKLEISREDPVNAGEMRCEWNFRGFHLKDVKVPLPESEEERTLGRDAKVFDILLPWQLRGDISFYVHMSTGPAAPYTYTEKLPVRYWYDGTKYTYKVSCDLTKISIGTVSITDWGGNIIHDVDM